MLADTLDIDDEINAISRMGLDIEKNSAVVHYATECLSMLSKRATQSTAINRLQTLRYTGEHLNVHSFKRLNDSSTITDYKVVTENFISKAVSASMAVVDKMMEAIKKMFKTFFEWIRGLFGGDSDKKSDKENEKISEDIKVAYSKTEKAINDHYDSGENLAEHKSTLMAYGNGQTDEYTDSLFAYHTDKKDKCSFSDELPFWHDNKPYVPNYLKVAEYFTNKCMDSITEINKLFNETSGLTEDEKNTKFDEFYKNAFNIADRVDVEEVVSDTLKDLKKLDVIAYRSCLTTGINSKDLFGREEEFNFFSPDMIMISSALGAQSFKFRAPNLNILKPDDPQNRYQNIKTSSKMADEVFDKYFAEKYLDKDMDAFDKKIIDDADNISKLFDSNVKRIDELRGDFKKTNTESKMDEMMDALDERVKMIKKEIESLKHLGMIEYTNMVLIMLNRNIILIAGLVSMVRYEINNLKCLADSNRVIGRYIRAFKLSNGGSTTNGS